MSAIKIELAPAAQKVMGKLATMPARMGETVAAAMSLENQYTLANIVEKHLTGQGPYPVDRHRLGERSHQLRGSARTTEPVIEGNQVTSSIGSQVIYAGIHEFGGVIHHAARQVTVRLRTDRQGNLIRQPGHEHLAMFARTSHKRAKEVKSQAPAYDVQMPARAPFMTGIQERSAEYGKSISAAIINALSA